MAREIEVGDLFVVTTEDQCHYGDYHQGDIGRVVGIEFNLFYVNFYTDSQQFGGSRFNYMVSVDEVELIESTVVQAIYGEPDGQ